MFRNSATAKLVRTGIIAALYAALCFLTFPIASGAIKLRLSEGLCLLPLIFPEATIGVAVGCFIVNLVTGCALPDVIFGTLITLFAAALTYLIGKVIKKTAVKIAVGGAFPVLFNAFLLPVIWYFCYGGLEYAYMLSVLFLFLGEGVSVYLVGVPIVLFMEKLKKKKSMSEENSATETESETEKQIK